MTIAEVIMLPFAVIGALTLGAAAWLTVEICSDLDLDDEDYPQ